MGYHFINENPLIRSYLWFIFSNAPTPRHLVLIDQLELPAVAGPADDVLVLLVH